MLIILFKPFKLGDVIEAQGVSGEAADIQIFVTQLVTPNNQMILFQMVLCLMVRLLTILNYMIEEPI